MKFYIVRHGIALNVGEAGIRRDHDRTLSPEGKEKTSQAAAGMAALGCRPDRVATSPLPRAEETAQIMAEVLCPKAPVDRCDFLAPGAATQEVLDWLAREKPSDAMVVGHMPDVARMASELLTGGQGLELVFKKAAVCCVSFDGEPALGEACLEWLLQPRVLRALGKT